MRIELKRKGRTLFTTTFKFASANPSRTFTIEGFAEFIRLGEMSYGVSRYESKLTCVDLKKSDVEYTPLTVNEIDGEYAKIWRNWGFEFDSGFATGNSVYTWTYKGLRSK